MLQGNTFDAEKTSPESSLLTIPQHLEQINIHSHGTHKTSFQANSCVYISTFLIYSCSQLLLNNTPPTILNNLLSATFSTAGFLLLSCFCTSSPLSTLLLNATPLFVLLLANPMLASTLPRSQAANFDPAEKYTDIAAQCILTPVIGLALSAIAELITIPFKAEGSGATSCSNIAAHGLFYATYGFIQLAGQQNKMSDQLETKFFFAILSAVVPGLAIATVRANQPRQYQPRARIMA